MYAGGLLHFLTETKEGWMKGREEVGRQNEGNVQVWLGCKKKFKNLQIQNKQKVTI